MALTGTDVTGRRLVIFDFDGTLANTVDGITSTARRVLLNHGFTDQTLGDLTRLVGPPFPQAFTLVYGLDPAEAEQVTAEYRAIYEHLGLSGWPPYDGVAPLLADLKAAGRLLAVASSKRCDLVRRALADGGLAPYFDYVAGKVDDRPDPKPGLIRQVISTLGLTAADAVMVGDRRFDVEAARACDVPCVGVHYGNTCPRAELEDAGACAVAETIDELRTVLLG